MLTLKNYRVGILLACALLLTAPTLAQEGSGYTCQPCGCANDGKTFDEPGDCSACGMPLVAASSVAGPLRDPASSARPPRTLNVAIVVHQGVELLDFAGPGEVFQAAARSATRRNVDTYNVYTVAPRKEDITSQHFLTVRPQYDVSDAPTPDVLVIPGGATNVLIEDEAFMNWVAEVTPNLKVGLSVCTGAFVFGEAGFLENLDATTWFGAIAGLRESNPNTNVHEHVRFIDNGRIVTTAGVSAGIDGALHVVSRLSSLDVARDTARYMEYRWEPQDFQDYEDGVAVHQTIQEYIEAIRGAPNALETLGRLTLPDFVFTGVNEEDSSQLVRTERAEYLEHFGHHDPGQHLSAGIETLDVCGTMARARSWFENDQHVIHVTTTLLKLDGQWRFISQSFFTDTKESTGGD